MAVHLHQALAVAGGYEFLKAFEAMPATALPREEIQSHMSRAGVRDAEGTLTDFLAAGILGRYGERVGLTSLGIRTTLLLDALNGGDLREIYRRLGRYDSSLQMYELVREGMTNQFLESVNYRPGFSRLYFCSPWISLNQHQQSMLTHAVILAEKRGLRQELLVITRPAVGDGDKPPVTVQPFLELGASIFLNRQLHTKLYIREPDRSGGYSMAIVGSQNLTKSQYLELGIRINADSAMVDQLIGYFWELANASMEA